MLTQKLARDLLPLVNHEDNFDLLNEYIDFRIDNIHKQMEGTTDIRYLQGAIYELRLIKKLRDIAKVESR